MRRKMGVYLNKNALEIRASKSLSFLSVLPSGDLPPPPSSRALALQVFRTALISLPPARVAMLAAVKLDYEARVKQRKSVM